MLTERGQNATLTLLDGKGFQRILDHARTTEPFLLVVGRIGVHSDAAQTGLGSTAENLLRTAPCDLFLSARQERPHLDLHAEETVRWTPEAEERMKGVPDQVRGVARTAVLRLAVEKGHTVVTSSVIDEAMDRFMPKKTAEMTRNLAAALARDRGTGDAAATAVVCLECGVAASDAGAVRCSVCGGTSFDRSTPEMLAEIVRREGGSEPRPQLDGRTISWTAAARAGLRAVADKKARQAARARIEKTARLRRLDVITFAVVRGVVEEETGEQLQMPSVSSLSFPQGDTRDLDGRRIVALDAGGNALLSRFDWTEEAARRLLRVPPGFMRARTQERIEALARERGVAVVELDLVHEGIELGRRIMGSMVGDAEGGGRSSHGRGSLNEAGEMHDKATGRLRLPDDES